MCQHSRTSLAEEILIGEIVSMKIVVPERKATEWKVTERKATERKETERKATERKETERKETERKETERKETDRKETDRKETEMEGSTKGEEASSVVNTELMRWLCAIQHLWLLTDYMPQVFTSALDIGRRNKKNKTNEPYAI